MPIFRCFIAVVLATLTPFPSAADDWSQWGGPNRNFTLERAPAIADWGERGPQKLWSRTLGPGYSGIVANGDRLITMTRREAEEAIVALSSADGTLLWEHTYSAPTADLQYVDTSYGDAPQATPLVVNGHVYGLGFTGILTCLDARSGKEVWSHDLRRTEGVGMPYFGHAASPVRVGDTVVVLAGGARAYDLASGELRWRNRDFEASYASPILVDTPAGPQLVAAAAGELVGLDPHDGRLLWRHEHANQHRTFLASPIEGGDGLIFASAYFLGSTALRLTADGGVTAMWQQPDLQVAQTNAVRIDKTVFASHNRNLIALDVTTGAIVWREAGVGRSTLLRVGDQTLLLNDRGGLTVANLDRTGYRPGATAQVLEGRCWTAPTLIGTRMYARNQTDVVAFDLGARAAAPAVKADAPGEAMVAPVAFQRAAREIQAAARGGDLDRLMQASRQFDPWLEDPSLGAAAHYFQGFAAWQASFLVATSERLALTDRAVESLEVAVGRDAQMAEAYALLATLYSAYYRLAPSRASVIGPIGVDHLHDALRLAPDNPRVLAIKALDTFHTPVAYGGDPDHALVLLAEAIAAFDAPGAPASRVPSLTWGPAQVRFWLAQRLLADGEPARIRALLKEALTIDPSFVAARRLLDRLSPSDTATTATPEPAPVDHGSGG